MAGKETEAITLASLRGRPARSRRGRDDVQGRPQEETAAEGDAAAGTREQMGLLFAPVMPRDAEAGRVPAPAAGAAETRLFFEEVRQTAEVTGVAPRQMPAAETRSAPEPTEWQGASGSGREPARVREPHIWSVRGIVADLRERVEGAHREVLIEGEISACRPASSGHLYLTMKEGEAQLSVVLFRRQAQLLRFRPATGMAVLARGRLSIYEGRGELQLVAESLEPRGTGALLLAFEKLKQRLAMEGLFEAARKRALPAFPRTIGIVTSTAGAVLHDVITVVRRRHARLNLLVYPATVQGAGCAASVAAGIAYFNAHPGLVDVILLARGGGSPEDLFGFNDEGLARAIVRSGLPVVSAIGHETDFSIADFVADLRAPTPSAAAEMMTASQHRIGERLEALDRSLRRASRMRLLEARHRFLHVSPEQVLRRVQGAIGKRAQRVDELARRLEAVVAGEQRGRRRRLELLERRLERQQIGTRLARDRDRLSGLSQRLQHVSRRVAAGRRGTVDRLSDRLQALSPFAVLARGYALVYAENEGTQGGEEKAIKRETRLVRSSEEVEPGQRLVARFAHGAVSAEVLEIDPR